MAISPELRVVLAELDGLLDDLRQAITVFLEVPQQSRRLRPVLRRELRRTQDTITRVLEVLGGAP